jgi:1,4-dihydroxy-2-naphthoate octaprenyltransferase
MQVINYFRDLMSPNLSPFRLLLRYARLLDLLAGVLLYALGAGLTVYLGNQINWSHYFLGQGCVTMLQLSAYFLKSAFDLPAPHEIRFQTIRDEEIRQQATLITRNTVLLAAASTLTAGAVLTVILFSKGLINPTALIIIGIGLALVLAYAIPPFRLVYSGYGELIQAILIANITPALSFTIQFGELHQLLASLTFPLTALYIALQLATSLRSYTQDEFNQRRTAMTRLGWVYGMNLHNLLILFAYLVMVTASFIDLPWVLLRSGLFTLPIGLFQIWQMLRIARGAKPNWVLLTATAAATFALTAYFITFALWTS